MPMLNPALSPARCIARVLRDLLRTKSFETLADLTDALKTRCAQLHLGWTNEAITEAYRLVGSNTPLVAPPPEAVRAVSSRGSDDAQRGPAPHGGTA